MTKQVQSSKDLTLLFDRQGRLESYSRSFVALLADEASEVHNLLKAGFFLPHLLPQTLHLDLDAPDILREDSFFLLPKSLVPFLQHFVSQACDTPQMKLSQASSSRA